ncbi:MAG: long-chain fatty acid--CoA ligase [Rickettsiales bacterium]|nr:long-chain fatty acid--CoA ligase [Rickettsiales bacterium]
MTDTELPWLDHYPDNVDWHTPLKGRPLFELLDDAVAQFPDNVAIRFMGRAFTYKEVDALTRKFAAGLKAQGVKRGVKVGICLPNCPQAIIAYFGILRTGATVVNYSPLYSKGELGHKIDDSGTEVMVTLDFKIILPKVQANLGGTLKRIIVCSLADVLPMAKKFAFLLLKRGELAAIPQDDKHLLWEDAISHPPLEEAPKIHPEEDIAVLQYTGGTTGSPKGVILTHANCSINADQCRLWFANAVPGEEKFIGILPLFHVFAMTTIMNFGISIGAEIILHPKFELKNVLIDIAKYKITIMPGVSTLFSAINNCTSLNKYDLTSMKYCISGGGPLPEAVKEEFESLTGCSLVEGYGLSESSPVVSCNPLTGENRTGSIGLPLPGTVLEIIDKDDHVTPMPIGEEGEICIRGPQVMQGYWQQLEATNDVLRKAPNGEMRLHTGDVGVMSEDGYFKIVDRMKELIISGGYNVYPRCVEEAIYQHEAVADCAVIGINNAKRGEVPKAFIVFKKGQSAEPDALRAFLKDHLPPYAIPHDYEFRAELPKTLVGKVDKKPLREENA